MAQAFRRFFSLNPNILDDAYNEIVSIKNDKAITVIQLYDIYSFAILHDINALEDYVSSILKSIEKIDGVKKGFMVLEDRLLIVHVLYNNVSFCNDIANAFVNTRKYLSDESNAFVSRYKCGTIKLTSNEITRETILEAYIKASAAASRGGIYDSNNHIFHDSLDATLSKFILNRKLASDLQNGIYSNRLTLAFQPVFDTITNKIAWYEILLRLIDSNGNITSPGNHIAAAEEVGFIHMIDEIILRSAISELNRNPSLSFSINISTSSIDKPMFIEEMHHLLANNNASSRLTVEITETTSSLGNIESFKNAIEMLRKTGLKIALDDFGAGNTSVQQLLVLEPDIIKIDGELIKNIKNNRRAKFFLDIALEYSKEFNCKTVAECIETQELLTMAQGLKIDYIQGNYFGKAEVKK